MTLGQTETYLTASREYLNRASKTLKSLGMCCGMGSLWAEQQRLESLVQQARYNDNLGFAPIIAVAVLGAGFLAVFGEQVYRHYTQSKSTSEYYDCFEKVFNQYKASGYSEAKAYEQAGIICKQTAATTKEGIVDVAKLAIYSAIGIAGFYFIMKLLKD